MVDLSSSLYMSTFTRVFCYSNLHKKIPSPWSAWPCILRYPDIPSSAESHQQIELHLGKSDKTSHRCVHRRAPCSQCICWPPEGGERLKECCWKIENKQIETDMIWYDMMATWCQLDKYPWKTRAVWSSSMCSCDLIYHCRRRSPRFGPDYEKSDCWNQKCPKQHSIPIASIVTS